MKVVTSRFGELDIKRSDILYFPEGIPGFQDYKKYILLKKDDNKIFFFLHSLESKDLMFIITNPYFFKMDYTFKISNDDCSLLSIHDIKEEINQIGIFVVTKIDKNKNVFINLKAPICINFKANIGKQIILYNSDYSHEYKLEFTKDSSGKNTDTFNNIDSNPPCAATI